MRHILFALIALLAFSCNSVTERKNRQTTLTSYDSLLAKQYGADDYGMKQYVVAFLKRGPNRNMDSVETERLQKAHLKNIVRLGKEGKLICAGPFLDDGDIRGIYIFNVKTIEEAQKLTQTDPAIQKGSLIMELHQWYGSAALMAIPEIHPTIEKKNVTE